MSVPTLSDKTILFTAHAKNGRLAEQFAHLAHARALHLPLEHHRPYRDQEALDHLFNGLSAFSNIMYGSLMHAEAFIKVLEQRDYATKKAVQQLLNLTKDAETAEYLEQHQIPAIRATESGKAIEVMEMLIRLNRLTPTIYPSVEGYYEEFPALMHELGANCVEIPMLEFTGPKPEELDEFRQSIQTNTVDAVFFHAPNAVVRTQTAFPALDTRQTINIALNDRTAEKMLEKGIQPHAMAKGNWHPEDLMPVKTKNL